MDPLQTVVLLSCQCLIIVSFNHEDNDLLTVIRYFKPPTIIQTSIIDVASQKTARCPWKSILISEVG